MLQWISSRIRAICGNQGEMSRAWWWAAGEQGNPDPVRTFARRKKYKKYPSSPNHKKYPSSPNHGVIAKPAGSQGARRRAPNIKQPRPAAGPENRTLRATADGPATPYLLKGVPL